MQKNEKYRVVNILRPIVGSADRQTVSTIDTDRQENSRIWEVCPLLFAYEMR